MRRWYVFIIALFLSIMMYAPIVGAEEGVQVRPLMYKETLQPGQTKRGVLDIANPTKQKLSLHVSVKLFRQANDNGKLEFYDAPDATAGIVPEYTDFDLNGQDALRLSFSVDGAKLPQGDVFAAIFVTAQNSTKIDKSAIMPVVQVGTLLILQNGTAGPRDAEITNLMIPWLQIGTTIQGTASVKNPASADHPTGFFPMIKVIVSPWGDTKQFEAPLVYAGRTRTFDFSLPSDQFGIYKVTFMANNASAERYIFLITGRWRYIIPALAVILLTIVTVFWWWRRKNFKSQRKFSFH